MERQNFSDSVGQRPTPIRSALLHGHPVSTLLACSRAAIWSVLALILVGAGSISGAQDSLPFEVSNPKNQKLPANEAGRIYFSACERVARAIRPESPPHLHPKFVLVLGAKDNETVRRGAVAEVHLKAWDSASFAEAVVLMAAREILNAQDLTTITREALLDAQSSVTVSDLKQGR
jgi:hypothetical protein